MVPAVQQHVIATSIYGGNNIPLFSLAMMIWQVVVKRLCSVKSAGQGADKQSVATDTTERSLAAGTLIQSNDVISTECTCCSVCNSRVRCMAALSSGKQRQSCPLACASLGQPERHQFQRFNPCKPHRFQVKLLVTGAAQLVTGRGVTATAAALAAS